MVLFLDSRPRPWGEAMVKIVDVAALAGVSSATVSRVLNGIAVREDLAVAVRQAAEELAYSPNRIARSLRRQHSDVIALIVPDIENPFFTALARGVEDVAQEAGFSVVLCNSDDDQLKEDRYLAIAESENMAGVIIAPASAAPNLAGFIERNRSVVVVDRAVTDKVDQVVFDNIELGRRAAVDLANRGFVRIACVTGPLATDTGNDRAAGWKRGLIESGLPAPDELLLHANFRVDGGREAMAALLALDLPPDAVLATNNLVGVGVLQVLAENPRAENDIGVSVIGDLPFATSSVENLSMLPLRPREMGLAAARVLLQRIGGGSQAVLRRVLPVPAVEGPGNRLRQ